MNPVSTDKQLEKQRKKQITNMSYDPQNQRMSPEAIIKKAIVGNVEARVFMVMV